MTRKRRLAAPAAPPMLSRSDMLPVIITLIIALVIALPLGWFLLHRRRWRAGIAPESASGLIAAGKAVLLDIREPREWRGGVAQPAVLLPYTDLRGARTEWKPFLKQNANKQLIIYCTAGVRAGEAVAILRREGFKADNLGGFRHWTAAGLPVRTVS